MYRHGDTWSLIDEPSDSSFRLILVSLPPRQMPRFDFWLPLRQGHRLHRGLQDGASPLGVPLALELLLYGQSFLLWAFWCVVLSLLGFIYDAAGIIDLVCERVMPGTGQIEYLPQKRLTP